MSFISAKTINYASFVSNACCGICLSPSQHSHSSAMMRLLSVFIATYFTEYTVSCPLADEINFFSPLGPNSDFAEPP